LFSSTANVLRFALLDLRRDLRHFWILIACIALGVGTIALVGAVGSSLQDGLARDARQLLGGDIEARLTYRSATAEERALLDSLGEVSNSVDLLARAQAEESSILAAVRGADASYPLVGTVRTTPDDPLADLIGQRDGVWGALVSQQLLERLGIAVGDRITLGSAEFEVRGILDGTPDQASRGISIGYPALTSVDALAATDLIEPGSLARFRYKIVLRDGIDFDTAAGRIRQAFPQAGWHISAPDDATQEMARYFDLFRQFLTIVGLSALILGGLGVANAVSAYVNDRQRSIATMKALGATSGRVLFHFLIQIMAMTALGIVVGTLAAGAVTVAMLPTLGDSLALALRPTIDWRPLATSAAFGLLVGFLFAYPALLRAVATRPAQLFRSVGTAPAESNWRRLLLQPRAIVPILGALAGVLGVALLDTERPPLVFSYAGGVLLAFLVLRGAAELLRRGLGLLPPARHAVIRSAIRSIYRPASPAAAVILSLGLGMALLLVIAIAQGNLRHQLDPEMRVDAPDFIYMDLFDDEVAEFERLERENPLVAGFTAVPLVRASSFTINGEPPPEQREPPRDISVYFGDEQPLSYAAEVPYGSTVVDGEWWPADYSGPPRLSVSDELQQSLGLQLGDEITFLIYGDLLTATVANVRRYEWARGGVNIPFVLSPGALEEFPLSYFGLLDATEGNQGPLQRELVAAHPALVFLPMEEAIDVVRGLVDTISGAVAAIGAIALASGTLVIAGAIATGRRQREADAIVAKVLGATRGYLSGALVIEYAVVGSLAGVFAVGLGSLGAWVFARFAIQSDFAVDPVLALGVVLGALGLTVAIGVAMAWTALSGRPAQFLRG
jgi:putative ABC transport system permease protein